MDKPKNSYALLDIKRSTKLMPFEGTSGEIE